MKEKPMSRFINNTHGIMDLSLSQIALFLATGILLAVVLSFVFFNNWQRTNELQSSSSSFSTLLEDMDKLFYENTTRFDFPEKTYHYTIQLSSEYIFASTKGFFGDDLHVAERFFIHPWIQSSRENWTTKSDLHDYLNTSYGHYGTQDDPIPFENFTELHQEQNTSAAYYALHPLEILLHEPIFIKKVTIFYGQEQKYDVLLVYQLL
jgi:hypothetical protein